MHIADDLILVFRFFIQYQKIKALLSNSAGKIHDLPGRNYLSV